MFPVSEHHFNPFMLHRKQNRHLISPRRLPIPNDGCGQRLCQPRFGAFLWGGLRQWGRVDQTWGMELGLTLNLWAFGWFYLGFGTEQTSSKKSHSRLIDREEDTDYYCHIFVCVYIWYSISIRIKYPNWISGSISDGYCSHYIRIWYKKNYLDSYLLPKKMSEYLKSHPNHYPTLFSRSAEWIATKSLA